MLRGALIALALLAGAPAAAAPDPFPAEGERFYLSVRAPADPGHERFARVYGDPAEDRWSLYVTCGTVAVATGRERIELQATGVAARDRWGNLGWTWTPVGGGETGGGALTEQRGLDASVVMAAPCPSGPGELSSGD